MSRKVIYGVLALPVLVFLIYLVALPRATRQTFLSEFKHRTTLLFGANDEAAEGPQGLRLERPEEYGIQPAADEESSAEATPAGDQSGK